MKRLNAAQNAILKGALAKGAPPTFGASDPFRGRPASRPTGWPPSSKKKLPDGARPRIPQHYPGDLDWPGRNPRSTFWWGKGGRLYYPQAREAVSRRKKYA